MAFKSKTKLAEWQDNAKNGGICARCGKTTSYLTVDHIIPISIIDCYDDTGNLKYDWEENYELICMPCNHFKGGRIDSTNPKSKELLLKLLN